MKFSKLRFISIFIISHILAANSFGLTAKFSYTKRTNCAPAIVEFINSSTSGTGITYTWNFGLGATVTSLDNSPLNQLYTKPGQYKVTLVVSDGTNTDSTSTIISIAQAPKANFSANVTSGCAPLTVGFTSTSVPGSTGIVSSVWDFRNGDYKVGQSVQYVYKKTGKYSVILKVIDQNGCYGLMESDSLITVANKPKADFSASDTFACDAPLNVTFRNLSSGSTDLTYWWDYGNGKTSADVGNSAVYSSKGAYNVKLKVTDQYGCSDSLIKSEYIRIGYPEGLLKIYNSNNQQVNKTTLCSGTYTFVYSVANLPDYNWSITDNNKLTTFTGKNSITYQVSDTGTLVIDLIYGQNSACTDNIHKTFKKSYIKADFALDTTLFCSLPREVNLQNASKNGKDFAWYFLNRQFSSGTNASYTITRTDLPETTYQQLYNHELSSKSLYFSLVAHNSDGCADSATKNVTLSLPAARFMPNKVSGCIPLQVAFSDSSKSAWAIDKYTYLVGSDPVTSSVNSPVDYTFTQPGVYEVTEVIESGGCSDSSHVVKITVGDKLKPDVSVTPSEVCNGGSIRIVGTSDNNSVVNAWRLSAPNIFDLSFTHRPDTSIVVFTDTAGLKDISLQVNYNGCFSDTVKKAVFRINGPVGNFEDSFSCDSALVYRFTSKIKPATSLAWNIDTASYSNVDSMHYRFPKSGDYLVKLTASDNSSGCSLTRSKIIKVRQIKASFTLNDTVFCAGDSVKLNASSSVDYINSCYNEGFLWSFGDNSPSRRTYLTNYSHIYTSKGKFKILLITRADNGCLDSLKKVVTVHKPSGSFTTDKKSGCLPSLLVNFTNTSTDTSIIRSVWNFGDGSTDSTKNANIAHTYASNVQKTYNPSLTVYDAYQCQGYFSVPITLVGVNSDFQADDNAICSGETVTFAAVGKGLDSLVWNFGDGTTSGTNNAHTYSKSGLYTVSLAASKNGCRDTVSKSNYISVQKADASFWVSDSALVCYPDTVQFIHKNLNGSPVVDRTWIFDSQELSQKSDSVIYIYTRPGKYGALLSVRTLNGCKASSSKIISIAGPSATVSFDPKKICYGETINFRIDSSSNITGWQWLFGDGATSAVNPVSHKYTSRGKIIPAIVLSNSDCSITKMLDTLFISTVQANFISDKDSTKICSESKVNFVNTSVNSSYYTWEINHSQLSNDYSISDVVLPKIGDNAVTLIATGEDNCTDTLTKIYTVVANPAFSINGDSLMCKNQDSIVLSVNQESGWRIKWSPSSSLSSTNTFRTVARPSNTITYTALVTDANGCSTSKEKKIAVNQLFNFSRIPVGDTTISLGANVRLIILADTSSLSYSWSPNYNITCLNCSNPYVSPTKDATYKVDIKNSCVEFVETFNIKVINDTYLEAPSAFTPNGDGNNDVFRFEGQNIKSFELKIFNRWGKMVYSTHNIQDGWDGTVNGHLQNIDSYTYYVKAESIYGYKFEKTGTFLLLK